VVGRAWDAWSRERGRESVEVRRCLGYLAERNSRKEARLFRVEWIIRARLGL